MTIESYFQISEIFAFCGNQCNGYDQLVTGN